MADALGRSGTGPASLADAWRDVLGATSGLGCQLEELIETPGGVLALARFRGEGRTSGVPYESWPTAALHEWRENKVVRLVMWTNRETALVELGLKGNQ